MAVRHFLNLKDISANELDTLLDRAIELKGIQARREIYEPFKNYVLAMVFEKSSTRTRLSFESGIIQLGGQAIFMSPRDTQFGRGEPLEDSARVMSQIVDIVMIRTFDQQAIELFAKYSDIPVINALTDQYHPCQLLADLQTYREVRGSIKGKTVTWVGDGNNMCHSYINAAIQADFKLNIACPEGYDPDPEIVEQAKGRVKIFRDHKEAMIGSSLVSTDVWASMGQEEEQQKRIQAFKSFQVSPAVMDLAEPDALFMHCLPAHRGEEISHDMLDDPRSVVFQQAGNRLHAQKALMEFLLNESRQ